MTRIVLIIYVSCVTSSPSSLLWSSSSSFPSSSFGNVRQQIKPQNLKIRISHAQRLFYELWNLTHLMATTHSIQRFLSSHSKQSNRWIYQYLKYPSNNSIFLWKKSMFNPTSRWATGGLSLRLTIGPINLSFPQKSRWGKGLTLPCPLSWKLSRFLAVFSPFWPFFRPRT